LAWFRHFSGYSANSFVSILPLSHDSMERKEYMMSSTDDFSRNNLDCLRLILALIVVVFHFCALTSIYSLSWLNRYFDAHSAVKAFFVISGILIYRSYVRSSSFSSYLEKRARRIYPAYFTVVTLAAIALCPMSILPAMQYFGIGFWKYLGANYLFLNFLVPKLPGVFTTNDIPSVNGALWTLKIEVAFYIFVPVLHYLFNRFGTKLVMTAVFCFSYLWKYGFAYLATIDKTASVYSIDGSRSIYYKLEVQLPAQLLYFSAGILLLLYFDTLKLHFRSIFCITVCAFFLDHCFLKGVLDVVWISGIVFLFGFWRYFANFSKHGDFSYGVYIVHFPILQAMVALGLTSLNPALFLALSLFFIGLAAFLMWNLVERRFLQNSSHYRQVIATSK
jgi:peptidoglycan/LPS O-acetylase OafA/YrhL